MEEIQQRTEISARQKGDQVILSWRLPTQNAPAASVLNLDRVDVYRLLETPDSPLTLSEEEFASRSVLISSLKINAEDFRRGQMFFTDDLKFSGQPARLRYAIRFTNSFGQKAVFSNFSLIEPAAQIAEPPLLLRPQITQKAIRLEWEFSGKNVDGSTPANVIGYNVYRITNGEESETALNREPVTANNFRDESFVFGKNYRYFVRAISIGDNGNPIESSDSEKISVSPKDIFPPGAPSDLTVAAAPNNISIFFVTNPEKDVTGYKVYRSSDRAAPLSEWTLLNKQLLTTNTFQDAKVVSGTTYYYYLTAVDGSGNVSEPSVVVSETAP